MVSFKPSLLQTATSQEEKRRRTALREARIAFLEEEVPALVARNASMESLKKKMAEVNKKLGDKFEISESELQGTYDACRQLMEAGEVRGFKCFHLYGLLREGQIED